MRTPHKASKSILLRRERLPQQLLTATRDSSNCPKDRITARDIRAIMALTTTLAQGPSIVNFKSAGVWTKMHQAAETLVGEFLRDSAIVASALTGVLLRCGINCTASIRLESNAKTWGNNAASRDELREPLPSSEEQQSLVA